MPDQPTPSPDEFFEIIGTTARLVLESFEKEDPEEERYDADAREAFEFGFRGGVLTMLDLAAYRIARAADFDPAWTNEEVSEWLEREMFAAFSARTRHEVEASLRRILRDGESGE